MEIKSAFSYGMLALQKGMQGLDRNAAQLARAGSEPTASVVQPLVESRQNQLQAEAGAKVLSVLDQTLGSLLDTKA